MTTKHPDHAGHVHEQVSLNRLAFSATTHCLTGCAIGEVRGLALASDTVSIALMEIIDNAIMVLIPGAMAAGLDAPLFWGSLGVALLIAGAAAFPVNRWPHRARQGPRRGAPAPPPALMATSCAPRTPC